MSDTWQDAHGDVTNPHPIGTSKWLLYGIFGEVSGARECGMQTECIPAKGD